MTDKKLPIPVQLPLVTAALIFLVAFVQLWLMGRALIEAYEYVDFSDFDTNSAIYQSIGLRMLTVVACIGVFYGVLTKPRKRAAQLGLVLHTALLVLAAWKLAIWLVASGSISYVASLSLLAKFVYLVPSVVWAAWLGIVGWFLWPHATAPADTASTRAI